MAVAIPTLAHGAELFVELFHTEDQKEGGTFLEKLSRNGKPITRGAMSDQPMDEEWKNGGGDCGAG